MNIELSSEDLRRMPQSLATGLLRWLQNERLFTPLPSKRTVVQPESQLAMSFASAILEEQSEVSEDWPSQQCSESKDGRAEHSHIKLSELFDAGITRIGMPVRVRLKRERAKEVGRDYLNNLTISAKGTVAYGNEEFDKPSPLATKLNGSPANGWEYIEVKREGEWVRLETLRDQVRQRI